MKSRDMHDAEGAIQRAVFANLRDRSAPGVFAFHVPNAGKRSHIGGAILKGQGLTAGVPDIIAVKDGKCFALELKKFNGKLSENQKAVIPKLEAAGATVGVTYGLNEALRWLESHGILVGEAA